MTIAVSSDEHVHLVDALLEKLSELGHHAQYFGPREGENSEDWPDVTVKAIDALISGDCEEAIVMCWTGTGCSIVANKYNEVRAALCADAATARGARTWNHANVLALSLRTTSEALLTEILEAWFGTPYSTDDWNRDQIEKVRSIEREK